MNFERGFDHEEEVERLEPDDARRARRRRWLWIAGALLLAVVIAAIVATRIGGGGAGAEATEQRPSVTVTVPGLTAVDRVVSATGSLAARREMPVGVQGDGGKVVRVFVEPGQWVAAGQVLATIDRSVIVQQNSQLAAQIAVAEADARLAQSNLDRAQRLVDRGFVSKADVDRLTATRDAAAARVRVARAQLRESQERTGQLDIRAPAAGLVLTRQAEPGQVVSPGSGTLFRMARDGEMELLAQLSEQDLARMKVGMPADVTPVGTATSFRGRIWQLSPVIDPESRQGTVRIALSYSPALRPGGFAAAAIHSGTTQAPLLPESAVLSDAKGNYVYVVGADGVVARRDVTVGVVSDAGIAIASGLDGREAIVVSAGAFLNPGDRVKPVRAAAAR